MKRSGLNIRNKAFWSLDRLRGGHVRRAYEELKMADDTPSDHPSITEGRSTSLRALLHHATKHVPFYLGLEGEENLLKFPVINKNVLRGDFSEFLSNAFKAKDLVCMSTSGSTGTPFSVLQDRGKKARVSAELIYYNEKMGYHVGRKLIFLRSLSEKSQKSRLHQRIQNLDLINVTGLDDDALHSLLKQVEQRAKGGAVLMSYASTLDAFRDYFLRTENTYDFNVQGLISGSEMLYDDTRASMQKHFDCQCVSRYSNQENGVIGQDEVVNNAFVLNEAHYIVEVLQMEASVPVEPGTVGRIVITDLFNFSMPLIRYDTGDIGAVEEVEVRGIKKKAITHFGGRKIDLVYATSGAVLSPHKISVSFWAFPEIRQFQFIQNGAKSYEIILNVPMPFTKEGHLTKILQELLGRDAEMSYQYVEDIPALQSGKRKYIMNIWKH